MLSGTGSWRTTLLGTPLEADRLQRLRPSSLPIASLSYTLYAVLTEVETSLGPASHQPTGACICGTG